MFKLPSIHLALPATIILSLGLLIQRSLAPDAIFYQLVYILLGLILAFFISKLDLKFLPPFRYHLLIASSILLLITLVIGAVSHGATRWIDLGFFRFQPSEFVKPMLILSFASFLSSFDFTKPLKFFRIILLFSIPIGLIFFQPDLGSAIIIVFILGAMTFASDIRLIHLGSLALIGLLVMPALWFTLKPYQKARVASFLNPTADPLGRGYNSIQAVIAVGSGQIVGKGLGHGTQSQLRFLPERHTDFIFASLAEELGFVGSFLLITSYAWLIFYLLSVAKKTDTCFGYLAIVGISAMFISQAFVNIGMNLGMLPVTGITLPLVSQGGSSIVASLVSLGLVHQLTVGASKLPLVEIR